MEEEPKRTFRLDRHTREDARAAVDEEIAFHLELVAEELMAAGWSPEEARAEARRSFGDIEETRDRCTDAQTRRGREETRAMAHEELARDLKQAWRAVRSAPGYAALVAGTLAFGIAANTIVFSAMNPYLLRSLPYGHPDELVQVNVVNPVTGWDMDRLSYPQFLDWKARSRAFSGLAAYSYGAVTVADADGPERVQLAHVTANMFDVLQVSPALGRSFTPAEARPGAPAVVVLSDRMWRIRFGADPTVLGRTLALDGVKHTVVGVMPASFNFPFGSARLWLPIRADATASRSDNNLMLVGRLAPGQTSRTALTELDGIQHELAALHPDTDGRMSGVTIKPLREALNFAWDVLSIGFRVLLGAVFFVLLLACVNVASLTLARGAARRREIAVRASLGAGRARIVRQLLVESLVLASAGGALGVALSWWVAGVIAPVLPEDLFRVGRIDIDGTVLAFSLVLTLVTTVAFGLLPALQVSRVDLAETLKEGGRGGTVRATRTRSALVVVQVALAVILTSGAGLMLRSFVAVRSMDVGFDPHRVVVAEALLPANARTSTADRLQYVDRAVAAVGQVRGVSAASASTWIPMNHELFTSQVATPRTSSLPAKRWPLAAVTRVEPGYFATLGMTVLEGRDITSGDGPDARPVAVVSRTLARRLWPDEDPVGQALLVADDPAPSRTVTVVGVVSDARAGDLDMDDIRAQLYLPVRQGSGGRRYFLLARTDGNPSSLIPGLRGVLGGVDSDVPVTIRPMSAVLREDQLQWSIGSVFLGGFGVGAILLATLGIYGLMSYSVTGRRKEIGVRLALGATRSGVRRRIVGDAVRLAAMGLTIGFAGSLSLAKVVAATLYGVSPFDPLTLGVVLALFLLVAVAASALPAERASRTDPMGVLRSE